MFILIKRKSSVFTNSFVTVLFFQQLSEKSLFIAFKTNKPSTHVDVGAKKARVFSYKLCYFKYTDQTNQTLIPILIEPLLGILIA